MKTFASIHTGLVRKKNEDRYLIREITGGSILLAVADGMGGETAGDLFEINGEKDIMQALDRMLASFVEQRRMKLPGTTYQPCYKVVS